MTSIIFHNQAPKTQEKLSYVLYFYVSADDQISHFEELKKRFSHRSISFHDVMYERVSDVWSSVIKYGTEIEAKILFSFCRNFNFPTGNTGIHIQFKVSEFIMNFSLIWIL